MGKLSDLFRGNRCTRCDAKLGGKRENSLCVNCRIASTFESLGRSYHYEYKTECQKQTNLESQRHNLLIEVAGIFSGADVAIKTTRACPVSRNIAWANLDSSGKGHIIVDGISKDIPGGLEGRSPVFSVNGSAFGYIVNCSSLGLPGNAAVVLAKTANRSMHTITKLTCDHATDLTFSRDGEIEAWVEWADKAATVRIGDLALGPFVGGMPHNAKQPDAKPIVLSNDGQHYCFFASREHGLIAVIDDKEFGPYEGFREMPIMSASGNRVAYDVRINGKSCVVDGGEPGEPYDITIFGPSMDYHGKTIVFGAIRGGKCYVVSNGVAVETLQDRKAVPLVSPNGERIALVSLKGSTLDVVVDGRCINSHKMPEEVILPSFVWSSDSRRIAYLCGTQEGVFIMVDDERFGPFDGLRTPGIVFSDNGLHFAAIVSIGNSYAVFVDGSVLDYRFSYPADHVYVAPDGTVRLAEVDVLRRTINWLEARLL